MHSFSCRCLLTALCTLLVLVTAQRAVGGAPLTGALGNATVVENNPPDVTYIAVLPTQFSSKIRGSILASGTSSGIGVMFKANFSNLPSGQGPFSYHVHVNPVSSDGNCNSTLGHLDPFIRGEDTPCDNSIPQTCQVGDLSGKHGKVTQDPFTASYIDEFASTTRGIGAFLGNRSIVIHNINKTRLTCANFTLYNLGNTTTNSSSPIPFQGSATNLQATSIFGSILFSVLLTLIYFL